MKALICGDRGWDDREVIEAVVSGLRQMAARTGQRLTIVHGAAKGADTIAGSVADLCRAEVERYPAKWREHDRGRKTPVPCRCPDDAKTCKPAGPRRNDEMLRESKPDVVFAFHDDLAASTGTKDMVARARKADLPVYVIARAM